MHWLRSSSLLHLGLNRPVERDGFLHCLPPVLLCLSQNAVLHNVMPFYHEPNQDVRFGVVKSVDLCSGVETFASTQFTWFSSGFAGVILHIADAWEDKDEDNNTTSISVVAMAFKKVCAACSHSRSRHHTV
jgi:hypothetical protein